METQESHPEDPELNSEILSMITTHHSVEYPMPAPNVFDDAHEDFSVKQFFTPCLAEMAYLVSSGGEAAIIDPLREIDPYLKILEDLNLTLKYIFLTHFHADFVSGHYDLSQKTGASIVFGPTAKSNIEIITAVDE